MISLLDLLKKKVFHLLFQRKEKIMYDEDTKFFAIIIVILGIIVGEKLGNYWVTLFIIGTMLATMLFIDYSLRYQKDKPDKFFVKITGTAVKVEYIAFLDRSYIEIKSFSDIKEIFVKGDYSSLGGLELDLLYDFDKGELLSCEVYH